MGAFLVRRLLQSALVMWAVVTLVFVLVRVIGNPAALMLPVDAAPSEVAALSRALGLSAPIHEQYATYLQGLLHADLGRSVWMKVPAAELLSQYFPATLLLATTTMVLAIIIGVGLGILAATRLNSRVDQLVNVLSFASISLPEFWVGLVLIAFVSVQLHLLPTSGYGTWQHLVLPVVTLLGRPVGRLAQITRSALVDELAQQYMVTALSKGLKWRHAVARHALRNAMLGIITLSAEEARALVSGAVVVEMVFAWPGVGQLSIQAIRQRDPDVVVAIVLVLCGFVLLLNLIIDVLYTVFDPRVRLQ